MLLIYPFSLVDQELALKNAKWIAELGSYKEHDIFILSDHRCDPEINKAVVQTFAPVFRIVKHRLTKASVDGWPQGANHMFGLATTLIQHEKEWPYFLWLEADAIPLRTGWLDAIVEEHRRSGKLFMGDRVQVGDIPLHMSGVAIYPNPIVNHAGEACRAHEEAWDMAARLQIIPQAHWTNLIEHAWKHPTFKDQFELNTQIAKETVLFHSSKDGSLIDRLREKAAPEKESHSVPTEPTTRETPSREEIGTRAAQPSPDTYSEGVVMRDGKVEHAPTHDIFIRTYPGDYEWLGYCLRSISRFVTGFRKIWIVSPGDIGSSLLPVEEKTPTEWKVMNDETEDGYLAQQITKLYADVITENQADYILHVDSDIVFTRPTTPGDFFTGDKMTWYYTPYSEIQTPWQPITEKFMGFTMPYEFMRRLPMMVPSWLYPKLREFCHARHGQIISDYIRMQPQRSFSEFNALGAYAYFNHPDGFSWTSTLPHMPPPFAKQFFSWGGLTAEVKAEIDSILGGMGESSDAPSVPTQIKKLPFAWVLEGDQISQWVEQEGRLDHDQNLLPHILKHINPGDTVVDAGAFIGDHTVAYSEAVGKGGIVYAFEPNPVAYQCLRHNTEGLSNVNCNRFGLSDASETVPLSGNNGNYGGAYVGSHMPIADVNTGKLDDELPRAIDFIKIDVEGYELKVLSGAEQTIAKHRPRMVIEINSEALARQECNPGLVLAWLENHDYTYSIIQENCGFTDPLYDILCLPKQPPENIKDDAPAHTLGAASPVASPVTKETVRNHVYALKDFADQSPGHKAIATSLLFQVGLRQKAKGKNKKYVGNPFKK